MRLPTAPPVDSAAVTCPSCRADVPAGARFCAECGQDLRLRGDERRIVTVLFADLVGYTALSETLDPEQVKNLVDGCFERLVADIDAFGGRVDKIIGDAIVALFGAPTAHEDDAERAVRAALRMQETLEQASAELGVDIRMRVGVNTGEVLVGALRAGGDYTAMGDVVNTASRLQTARPAGRRARRARPPSRPRAAPSATRRSSRSRPRAARRSCRRGAPTRPWRPPGYRPERNRARLVGREPELGLLCHSVENAIRNARGQLLLLLGEAGRGQVPPGRGAGQPRRERAQRADPRGPLRPLRRGQHLVAGGRRPAPRRRHPLERPGRQGDRAGPHVGVHRARGGRHRRRGRPRPPGPPLPHGLRLRAARHRPGAGPRGGHLARWSPTPSGSRCTGRWSSCCPTCTGPTTSCSSSSTRCSSGSPAAASWCWPPPAR